MDLVPIRTGPLGVNTWIVPLAGSAVLIVDPAGCEFTGDENILIDYLDEHDFVPVGILLTHGHFDHVSGLSYLKNAFPGIGIAIHEADADSIGPESRVRQSKNLGGMFFGEDDLLDAVSNLPAADLELKDDDTLDHVFSTGCIISAFSGDAAPDIEAVQNALSHWKIIHTPGHSPGSVCFFNDAENMLISGDTVFYHSFGRTDLFGGDEGQIRDSLVWLVENLPAETLVYPGHENYGFALGTNFA